MTTTADEFNPYRKSSIYESPVPEMKLSEMKEEFIQLNQKLQAGTITGKQFDRMDLIKYYINRIEGLKVI